MNELNNNTLNSLALKCIPEANLYQFDSKMYP